MIKYTEIDWDDYAYLKDKSGYYKVLFKEDGYFGYYKDGKLHSEIGPALINIDGKASYYFAGKFLGSNRKNFTTEDLIRHVKLKAFH